MKKTAIKILYIVIILCIGTSYSFAEKEDYSYGIIFSNPSLNGDTIENTINNGEIELYNKDGKLVDGSKKFKEIQKEDIIYSLCDGFSGHEDFYRRDGGYLRINKLLGYENTYGKLEGYYDAKAKEEKLFLSLYNRDKKITEAYDFEKEKYNIKNDEFKTTYPDYLKGYVDIGIRYAYEDDNKIYMTYGGSDSGIDSKNDSGKIKIIDTEKKEIRNILTWMPNYSVTAGSLVKEGKIYNVLTTRNNDDTIVYEFIEYDTVNNKRREIFRREKKDEDTLIGFFIKKEK